MNRKQLDQAVAKALKILREVEGRSWHSILLSGDVTDEVGEVRNLCGIAVCYEQFLREYPSSSLDTKQEAYRLLRAAFTNAIFAPRKHVSKRQFSRLLDMHLDSL